MAEVAPEIETKFDVAPDFAVPRLDTLAGKHGHVDVDIVHLASTYYDTEARDLLRLRLALRRRVGEAPVSTIHTAPLAVRGQHRDDHPPDRLGPARLIDLTRPPDVDFLQEGEAHADI